MAWSTRQLAELAGTSVRAVRHYHEVGLLDEPERRSNGYKSYGVAHLIRVLRIKRLAELGFSLAQIADMGEADSYPDEALRSLDAELESTIERLQRVRLELALVLRRSAPTELPPEMALATADVDMSDADRAFVVVMTRLMDPSAMGSYSEALKDRRIVDEEAEFDDLPEDADEETRRELAERLAGPVRGLLADHPVLGDLNLIAPKRPRYAAETSVTALKDLYNPAQIDVMVRLGKLLKNPPGSARDDRA
ncbi:MerR family transcriptional regulator [Nocardiopsis sp. ARC36]